MAAAPVATPVAKLWAHPDFGNEVMHLELALGTATGYKGVHKVGLKFEARKWVAGKGTRVVWHSESPEECAFILARLKLYPCNIPTPRKGRAKPGCGKVCSSAHCVAFACLTPHWLVVVQSAGTQAEEGRCFVGSSVHA